MGTSNSSNADSWTAGVFIFSGRPNPSWTLHPERAADLMTIWMQLDPESTSRTEPDAEVRLGYAGCYLANGAGECWLARNGCVTHEGACSESRRDPLRLFERTLLQSAPEGMFPADIVASLGREST